MEVTPIISIIIPTYNRTASLNETIESFVAQNFPKDKFEIIVSDNNSSDNTKETVQRWIQKSDILIRYFSEKRQGVHYARNSAAKIASGDILYFTDDDMIADKSLLKEIAAVFELNDKVGCATGRVLPKWEVQPPDWIIKLCKNAYLSLQDLGEESFVKDKDMGIWSCHQAIKREAFFMSGGFNPENTAGKWLGDGETGLNIKIKELGFLFAYNGKSLIYHCIPQSRMTQTYLNKRLANQGNCDSYTFYKRDLYDVRGLLKNIFVQIKEYFKYLFIAFRQYLFGNIYWHINLAMTYYCVARVKYDCKLIFYKNWRDLVLKNDWLND